MNWRDAFRSWLGSNDSDERPVSFDRWAGGTELLEHRLVLGSLSTDPSLAATMNVGSITNATPTAPTSVGNSDSSGSAIGTQFASLALQPDNSSTNTISPSQSATESTSQNSANTSNSSASEISSDNGVILTSFNDVSSLPAPLQSASQQSTSATLLSSTTAVATQNAQIATTTPSASTNALNSASPQSSKATPSSTPTSPPVAIDTSLTAVNTNVLVSSETVAAAKSGAGTTGTPIVPPWLGDQAVNTVIHYDFRDANGVKNEISAQQIQTTEAVLQDWSAASGGKVQFVHDTTSPTSDIVNIGVGNLSAVGMTSAEGGTLGTSQHAIKTVNGNQTSVGTIWLDHSETWIDSQSTGTTSSGTDFATVMAHEVGHTLGISDDLTSQGILSPIYSGAQDLAGITTAFQNPNYYTTADEDANGIITDNMGMTAGQLSIADVTQLLNRASVATTSNDAIIAIVDRNGNILGVRQEQDVVDTIKDPATLAFATDGAVSLARTAAFFGNDQAPLTSRVVEDLSQTTMLQREVEANPNSSVSTIKGPGFVAPVGIGGNFPAGVEHTPPVDLFNIEASNRIQTVSQTMVNLDSYGTAIGMKGVSQNRGIATLPGGIPIVRAINGTPTVIGGIGVFFPGKDGYATHEQGFVAGQDQTVTQRMNTNQELEAEFIAYAALGGSQTALASGVCGGVIGNLGAYAPVAGLDLPFGHISLNGIQLGLFGSTPGNQGLDELIEQFGSVMGKGTNSGTSQIFDTTTSPATIINSNTDMDPKIIGTEEPSGYLVAPTTSPASSLTTAEIDGIIQAGVNASNKVRAAIRLGSNDPKLRTGNIGVKMTFAITDPLGKVLAVYRMDDGTVFSTDVAIAKARNVSYYDDKSQIQPIDQVAVNSSNPTGPKIAAGTSFTNRTFRYLAEPFFPSGENGSQPPQFSILTDGLNGNPAGINITNGENTGAPAPDTAFTSVMGHDVFNVGTNFHDPGDPANQNGIIFFPGSTALYKNGVLVGGLGVSGDGVDQDDVVTFLAAQGYLPNGTSVTTADQVNVDGVRLPFQKFNRNPFG